MFVSHLSSFLLYFYVSAAEKRKNHLAQDKSFLAYPLCRGSTRKIGSCSGRLQNTVTTMAADGGNAPLMPHTRHCASF